MKPLSMGILWSLVSCSLATAPKAESESATEGLRACAAEHDDTRRLHCYDEAMAELRSSAISSPSPAARAASSPAVPAAATSPPPASAPATPTPERTFGQPKTDRPKTERPSQPKQISAKVTRVVERPGGLIVSLDNDQVWTQRQPEGYFALKVGDTVTVRAGLLGSFWLSSSSTGNRTIQVERTR